MRTLYISPKISRTSSTRATERSTYTAFTTSLSVHFFSDEEDGTFSRVYSTLSADNAPPYAWDMPFVRLLALHIMRESDYMLTGINYDDLSIATRHNLLQQMVNHGKAPDA